MAVDFLGSVKKQFAYYKMLGDQTFLQLNDDQFFIQLTEESNSIATIVKHLHRNMLSRWTEFLSSDGEKETRKRDAEFENDQVSRVEVLARWEQGWECLFKALNALTIDDLSKEIFIRNGGHSVVEAINRQLAHYPYHIGQIVFIGKALCDSKWVSLSVPKGGSKAYNDKKFSNPKLHFTDEFLYNENQ